MTPVQPPGTRATIAAVIPLYNGARFIEQAVRSVLAQTLPPDECIVVDDGSRDEGPEIVARLAGTLPVTLLRKPNGGQSSARNHGVAHARSRFVAFLDQDDAWYPDHLARLAAPFAARPGDASLGWTYADLDEADEGGRILSRRFLRGRSARHPKTDVEDCLGADMFVLPSAALIARHAFDSVGGFDERLSGYEDDDLFVRLLDQGYGNVFVDEPLSLWRIYAHSTTLSPLMVRSRMIFCRKVLERFGARPARNGGTLATAAIAPRFTRALFGEFARAGRRGDAAGMDAALDDLRTLMVPNLPLWPGLATRLAVLALRVRPLGRLASQGGAGIARRLLRMPADHRAAALQAEADRSGRRTG